MRRAAAALLALALVAAPAQARWRAVTVLIFAPDPARRAPAEHLTAAQTLCWLRLVGGRSRPATLVDGVALGAQARARCTGRGR